MNFSIQNIINKAVAPEEPHKKERWYATDLGKCLRGVYYARQGIEPTRKLEERNYRVFEAGNIFEEWVVNLCKKEPKIFVKQPETIYLEEWDLAVRPDMFIHTKKGDYVYEIKTVHSGKFHWLQKENPDEHYMMQLWCGMYAMKVTKGRLIYFSKDDLCISEYELDIDSKIGTKTKKQIGLLNRAWKKQELPEPAPAIINNKLNWKAKYCNWHDLCLQDAQWQEKAEKQCRTKK